MEEANIGKKLKDLRQYYEVSQRELAENICSQRAVSKIERGEMQPTAEILHQMAIKLGVKISYFFEDHEAPRFNYIQETKDKIDKLVRIYELEEAMKIIRQELKNPLFRKPVHLKYLLWKRAACHSKLTFEKEESLELLQLALNVDTGSLSITEEDIGIYINIGTVYMDMNEYEDAIYYFNKALVLYTKLPVAQWETSKTKIYMNLCIVYSKAMQFEKSLEIANEGLTYIYDIESVYLLGELYYQKGVALFYMGEYKNALRCMEKSMFILKDKGQKMFYDFIEENYLRFQRATFAQLSKFKPKNIDPTTATV